MSCQLATGTISYQSGSIILCEQNLEKKSARNKKGITHPNPFNSQTTIRFKVSYDFRVTVTGYNILGQDITWEVVDTKGNTLTQLNANKKSWSNFRHPG